MTRKFYMEYKPKGLSLMNKKRKSVSLLNYYMIWIKLLYNVKKSLTMLCCQMNSNQWSR